MTSNQQKPTWNEIEHAAHDALMKGTFKVPSETMLEDVARKGFGENNLNAILANIGALMESEEHLLAFMTARLFYGDSQGVFSGYKLRMKYTTHDRVTSNHGKATPADMIALCIAPDSAWQTSAAMLGIFSAGKDREDYFKDLESKAQRFAQTLGWRSEKAPASAHGVNTKFTPSGSYQSARTLISGMRSGAELPPMPSMTPYKEDRRS